MRLRWTKPRVPPRRSGGASKAPKPSSAAATKTTTGPTSVKMKKISQLHIETSYLFTNPSTPAAARGRHYGTKPDHSGRGGGVKKVRECRELINDAAAEVGPPW